MSKEGRKRRESVKRIRAGEPKETLKEAEIRENKYLGIETPKEVKKGGKK